MIGKIAWVGKIAGRTVGIGILAMALGVASGFAQTTPKTRGETSITVPTRTQQQFLSVQTPDANLTKREFDRLLSRYPPTVRGVFKEDPTLMTQPQYLAAYPALAAFLSEHSDIALNPAFYLDGLGNNDFGQPRDRNSRIFNALDKLVSELTVFAGFGLAIGLLTWLIRTFLDYRRWNRLSRVQAEVHTRLLDRFSTNEELMAYIATPAGSKFLQSAPISLDTGASSRSMGAPLSRIMWSLQAGLVLAAGGCGLMLASGRMSEDTYLPLEITGIIAVALGAGFVISAGFSFFLSHKMGLLEQLPGRRNTERPEA